MIALHRQFVFADQACFRLPELSLITGAILTYVAAMMLPIPAGFWDPTPTAMPGRLRRLLDKADFLTLPADDLQLRKKELGYCPPTQGNRCSSPCQAGCLTIIYRKVKLLTHSEY